MFLLDTNVVSELRRPRPHGAVVAWLAATPNANLHVSAFTIAELQNGVERARIHDAAKAAALDGWIDEIVGTFNVVAMDAAVAREWARLRHRHPEELEDDALIAATAQVHGMTVATRNVRHFALFGIGIVNPFETASDVGN